MSDRAVIPKGTLIHGTFPEGSKEAGRTYTVDVITIDRGHPGVCYCREGRSGRWVDVADHTKHCYPPRPDEVVWAGRGGYWHHAAVSDVEIIDPEETE